MNRNAILRRTGFLEGSQGAAFLGTPQWARPPQHYMRSCVGGGCAGSNAADSSRGKGAPVGDA